MYPHTHVTYIHIIYTYPHIHTHSYTPTHAAAYTHAHNIQHIYIHIIIHTHALAHTAQIKLHTRPKYSTEKEREPEIEMLTAKGKELGHKIARRRRRKPQRGTMAYKSARREDGLLEVLVRILSYYFEKR